MSENSSDDEDITPVFAFRADDIMKKQREACEELFEKVEKEDIAKAAEIEENDLLVKIHEKLKRKPRSRRKTSVITAPEKDKEKAVPFKRGKSASKKDEEKAAPSKRVKTASKKNEERAAPVRRSNRQRKKSLVENVNTDTVPKKVEESPINLPAAAKKRLLKIQQENQRETKRINDLNKRILSSCFTSLDDENMSVDVETENNITLKISYLSDISKLTVCENEKFSSIFSMVADLFKLNVTEVALWLRDESISLDDTPHSLNVKPWDIIDCIPYKSSDDTEKDTNANKLLIKMQSNDSRKKIDLYAHKLEKFQNIMEQYADIRSLPLKDLIFEFDGEKINGSDTPDMLDMESGSCVDVKVAGDSLKPTPPSILCVDLEKEEPVHKMLNICVLD